MIVRSQLMNERIRFFFNLLDAVICNFLDCSLISLKVFFVPAVMYEGRILGVFT